MAHAKLVIPLLVLGLLGACATRSEIEAYTDTCEYKFGLKRGTRHMDACVRDLNAATWDEAAKSSRGWNDVGRERSSCRYPDRCN